LTTGLLGNTPASDARRPARFRLFEAAIGFGVLAIATILLFLTAPANGEFWWSESPRNALNGAFVLDFLRELPLDHPVRWAKDYYLKYPALTVLFYPPLLHIFLAMFYAVLGVSHQTALICISAFLFMLAAGLYTWLRRATSAPVALAGALLLLASPELVKWGQQIMLEIPMMAFVVWAIVFGLRYGDRDAPRDLGWCVALFVAAMYVKQTAIFAIAGFALALLIWKGWALLRRRHVWIALAIALVALIPLAYMQMHFGSFNTMSLVSRPDIGAPGRFTFGGLTWYAAQLPGMMHWPALLLAVALLVGVTIAPSWRAPRGDLLVVFGTLLSTYAVLSMIDLKETRHGVPLLVPIAVMAGMALERSLQAAERLRWIVPAGAAALLLWTLHLAPTPRVAGYHEAAARIAALAPPSGRVVFAGNRDGHFIFNLRAHTERGDVAVIRADKLFLRIAIMPDLGLNPKQYSAAEISAMLNRLGVSYVVTVPRVWADAPVMASFADLLTTSQFVEIARIPVTGPVGEKELVIYRNDGKLSQPPESYEAELPGVGMTTY
jgi:4-amino-4-deoxy-L-arabinose transferase-like glycosyltransferase